MAQAAELSSTKEPLSQSVSATIRVFIRHLAKADFILMHLKSASGVLAGTGVFRALAFVVLAASSLASIPVVAQSPTSEQLEIFRNLTPEQQQAVLQQMGGQQGPTDSGASRNRKARRAGTNPTEAQSVDALQAAPGEPVLRPEDTVVLELSLPNISSPEAGSANGDRRTASEIAAAQRRARLMESLDDEGRRKLENLVSLVLSRNPYTLDRNANLALPGIAPIALGGLTEEQATQRLTLEPVLLPLEVHLSRLPVEKTGVAGLLPFGYDLFGESTAPFEADAGVPLPADYVVGPGDEMTVQLYGGQSRNVALSVDREGVVRFPGLGPIHVGGLTFSAARRLLETRVSQQMIGVQASVSMGETRAIRVFVLGEVRKPGSYSISGLGTVTSALFAAGGITRIGSLRDVQLKRQGVVVRRLDLYDFLIRGDTADDARLLPGDAIFIPPVGPTISVDGEVKRPAIYELRNESSIDEVVRMAGGLTAEADPRRATLTQVDSSARRIVLDLNLQQSSGKGRKPGNGDILRVARLRPQLDDAVILEGFVHRPGPHAWREGLRLSDVIGSLDELKPSADQHYVLVRREDPHDLRISVVSADLTAALAAPDSAANIRLAARDRITVFELAPGREQIIRPLLTEIRMQSELSRPTQIVRVGGRVKVPGEYPLETGMRVSDLLRAGGNLDASAYGGTAELTRYSLDRTGTRQTRLVNIDLEAVRRGDATANLVLEPFDYLIVKETPDWTDQESVTLRGEVRFPGTYPIRKGETLREVLDRAGGLTALAFPGGSAFTRRDLKEIEQQQLDRLTERLRSDLASMTLQAANAGKADSSQALLAGQGLLQQLQGSKAVGRFVIDLPGLVADRVGGSKDVVLRDGDELIIPRMRQEVTVIGEVQNPTSHLYIPALGREEYISASGGTTVKADAKHIYVVHADGSVSVRRASWLSRNYAAAIRPGDTIVVPLDTERMPRLPFWQAVTQIIYNLAVSVAAINSF